MRRVDLHIGVEKTGTTTIQSALAASRPQLEQLGVLYPSSLGPRNGNHTGLAVVGRDDDIVDDLRRWRGATTPATVAALRDDLGRKLQAEVAAATAATRVILSGEHVSSRLATDREVERLVDWLAWTVPGELHVHCYLRRQDRLFESRHSTAVRSGAAVDLLLPELESLPAFFDYETLLDRWSRLVGDDRMHVYRFERGRLRDGDVVSDFLHNLGLPTDGVQRPEAANTALDGAAQQFVALMNQHIPRFEGGRPSGLHRLMVAALDEQEPVGPPASLGPEERERMLGHYDRGNAVVARRWFGEETLFEASRDTSSEVAAPLDVERAVLLAAQVLRHVDAVHRG